MNAGFKIRLWQLLACVLCLLVLLLIGVILQPQPSASGLAVRLVGFTNSPGQPRSAVFSVTNLSHRTISFVTPDSQICIGGAWSDVVLAGSRVTFHLAGGRGTNVAIAVPVSGDKWRMPILWFYQPSRTEIYVHRCKNLLWTIRKEGSLSGWKYVGGLSGFTNFSAEMGLFGAESGGPTNRVGSR